MRGAALDVVQERLQRELDARGGNLRALAKEIAGAGGSVENVRRALYRILSEGTVPTPATSAMLERGLGRRAGYFTVSVPAVRSRRDRLLELEARVAVLERLLQPDEKGSKRPPTADELDALARSLRALQARLQLLQEATGQ